MFQAGFSDFFRLIIFDTSESRACSQAVSSCPGRRPLLYRFEVKIAASGTPAFPLQEDRRAERNIVLSNATPEAPIENSDF